MLLSVVTVMLLTTFLASCAPRTIIRPLKAEFVFVKKGDIVPDDGVWMTEHYLQVVGDAKIEKSHP